MHREHCQRGQVLWLIIIILGSLAQLAIITIQQAAASGVSVRRIETYWKREIVVEHIASKLQRMPLLRISAPDPQALWHPYGALLRTACAAESRQSFMQTPCIAANSPRWAWQLERDAEPISPWPGVTQRYRLRVQAMSANGQLSRWQFDYEQRSLP
ncbi:MAG: hypothetical protein ABIR53_03020 [Paraperlucidibaca sp.]